MRYSRHLLALALLAPSLALAQTPQINDVQLRPGSSTLWGAAFNVNNNQDIAQYNTAGSTVDSFRWFQGSSTSNATQLFSMSATGHIAGAATGGRMGAGTINAVEYYKNGVAIGGGGGTPGGSAGQIQYNNAGAFGGFTTSGDATINTGTGALTLATVNANVGSFGSATACTAFTTNAKGLITAASAVTCTPAIASITGLGTGVATALAINIGSAGAPVLFNGAGGTPASMVGTNITGTAAGLTAGTASAVAVGGITGLSANCGTWLATASSANLRSCMTDESGTGVLYFQGGDAGTPSALVGTNISGTAASLTVGNATKLATARAIGIAGSTGLTATGVNFDGTAAINPALTGTLVVANGGTNATTAAGARTSLGVSAAPTGFSVHKNATDQTGITDSAFTLVTWSTEIFDTGSNFASNTWTPPAGLINTSVTLTSSGGNQANGALFIVSFFKNTVRFKDQYANIIATGTPLSVTATLVDQANGTDAYDVRVFIDTTGSTGTVAGIVTQTYWTGMAFGP
jgi:hypothetical protein